MTKILLTFFDRSFLLHVIFTKSLLNTCVSCSIHEKSRFPYFRGRHVTACMNRLSVFVVLLSHKSSGSYALLQSSVEISPSARVPRSILGSSHGLHLHYYIKGTLSEEGACYNYECNSREPRMTGIAIGNPEYTLVLATMLYCAQMVPLPPLLSPLPEA